MTERNLTILQHRSITPSNLHLGHTYTTIIADTLKKYKEIQGYDVFFTTGTDEHGQKLFQKSEEAGKTPLEYIDPIVASAKRLWKKLEINYDAFVRSTDPQHEKNVRNFSKNFMTREKFINQFIKDIIVLLANLSGQRRN